MKYEPHQGKWTVRMEARGAREVRELLGEEEHEKQKRSLQKYLCAYFSTGDCSKEQGDAISPMGGSPKGGKVLKVRWGLPGCGKSGGLRLVVVAYCSELKVVIAEAFRRKDDPSKEDCEETVKDL